MKKFENAQLEVVKLNMANIIATSGCTSFLCSDDQGTPGNVFDTKGGDWDEE